MASKPVVILLENGASLLNNLWMEVYPDRIGAAVYPEFIRGRNDGGKTFAVLSTLSAGKPTG
jgi:hypothetical protein